MSKPQGNSIVGSTPHASTHDPIPTRRVSDKFSSSHSYAPECKCKKNNHETHLSN
jgi:hypothetical protein